MSRPPIDWGEPLPCEVPPEDVEARRRYDEAVIALREGDDERLLALTGSPWQTPVWAEGPWCPELGDFRRAGQRLAAVGRTEDAYRLGEALVDTDGSLMHGLIGLAMRRMAKDLPQAISTDRYHRVIRSEVERFGIPALCRTPRFEETPIPDFPSRFRQTVLRTIWGGVPGAADRTATLEAYDDLLRKATTREPDELFCAEQAMQIAPGVPPEAFLHRTSLTVSANLLLVVPRLRRLPNGYGRYSVAQYWHSVALWAGAFHIANRPSTTF